MFLMQVVIEVSDDIDMAIEWALRVLRENGKFKLYMNNRDARRAAR